MCVLCHLHSPTCFSYVLVSTRERSDRLQSVPAWLWRLRPGLLFFICVCVCCVIIIIIVVIISFDSRVPFHLIRVVS